MPIIPCFDPTTGASGGPAAGGGTPVTPPAATTEAVAAGGSPSATTFGAFTDPGSVISSYQATLTSTVGTTALAGGSGLGPYTYSGFADGDSFVVELDAKDAGGNVVATAVHAVDIAAAAAGGWSGLADIDLSDGDITDVTLTKGAGDTNILNSAGTSTRVVSGYLDTVNTSVGTCVASTANAGIRITNSQNNSEAANYWKLDPATYGQDMSAIDKVYLINIRVRNASIGTSNNDTIGIWCSSGSNHRTAGLAFGIQQYKSGANFLIRGMRSESGSQSVGATLRTSGSVLTDYVCTYVVWRGRLCDSFVILGTTMPTAIPTPGPTVLHTPQGTSAVSIDTGPSGFASLYAVTQMYSGGGSSAATVDRVEILELDG